MIEKTVEQTLKRLVEIYVPGAKCLKFVSPGFSGVPDRIILIPGGAVVFAETKRPGEKPRARQTFVHEMLCKMGFQVFGCVDTPEKARDVALACKSLAEYLKRSKMWWMFLPTDRGGLHSAGEWADQPTLGPGA